MKINGYSRTQIENMLRSQRKALTQEAASVRRQINHLEKRLGEITVRLQDIEHSENMLENW